MVGRLLRAVLLIVSVPDAVPLFPNPDLSLHAVTGDVPVIVDESPPSSHRIAPGILRGVNGD
jgi:hypothetical protein